MRSEIAARQDTEVAAHNGRQIADAVAAGHGWVVMETPTGRILFTDRTCRGARSWAAQLAEVPTSRVGRIRAGLYGMRTSMWSLTVTTRDEAIKRQPTTTTED